MKKLFCLFLFVLLLLSCGVSALAEDNSGYMLPVIGPDGEIVDVGENQPLPHDSPAPTEQSAPFTVGEKRSEEEEPAPVQKTTAPQNDWPAVIPQGPENAADPEQSSSAASEENAAVSATAKPAKTEDIDVQSPVGSLLIVFVFVVLGLAVLVAVLIRHIRKKRGCPDENDP